MKTWQEKLPSDLKFRGADSPRSAGLLHLLYASVTMIFWRVFMRISYSCPAHLKFGLTVDKWSDLVNMTGEAIDWLDAHETLYDVWMLVAYAATSCALVQVRNLFPPRGFDIGVFYSSRTEQLPLYILWVFWYV